MIVAVAREKAEEILPAAADARHHHAANEAHIHLAFAIDQIAPGRRALHEQRGRGKG